MDADALDAFETTLERNVFVSVNERARRLAHVACEICREQRVAVLVMNRLHDVAAAVRMETKRKRTRPNVDASEFEVPRKKPLKINADASVVVMCFLNVRIHASSVSVIVEMVRACDVPFVAS